MNTNQLRMQISLLARKSILLDAEEVKKIEGALKTFDRGRLIYLYESLHTAKNIEKYYISKALEKHPDLLNKMKHIVQSDINKVRAELKQKEMSTKSEDSVSLVELESLLETL